MSAARYKGWLAAVATAGIGPAFGAGPGASLARFQGIWESQGYGQVLEIAADRLTVYDLTDVSCARISELPFPHADADYESVEATADRLSFRWEGGLTRYEYVRRQRLPDRCVGRLDAPSADPEFIFATLWHAFNENYAFFAQRSVDWAGVYRDLRPRAITARNDEELFSVLSEALATLRDGHVDLIAGSRRFEGGRLGELREKWLADRGASAEQWPSMTAQYAAAVDSYLDRLLGDTRRSGASNVLNWGWLRPGLGYLSVGSMYVKPSNGERALNTTAQLALIGATMDRVMADLGDARALVVDVRFNGGGHDSVALKVAGYLTAQPRLALTKKAAFRGGFTSAQRFMVMPQGKRPYLGPVYVLQSGSTISAAEIFAIATKSLPNVTRIGTTTYGALSDALAKRLPNGWEVTLSNEVYQAADGQLFEYRGIPPDVSIESKQEPFELRLQQDLNTVLALTGPS